MTGELKLISKANSSGAKDNFTVDKKNACISVLVKQALDADASASEIDLQIDGPILAKIVEYMNHHKGTEPPIIEKPLRSKEMSAVVKDAFDATFIDGIDNSGANRQDLYDIILAANYLNINGLLNLGCAKVASLIKGQPLEKIKDILAAGTKNADEKKTE